MRHHLVTLFIFLLGLALGAAVASHVWLVASRALQEASRAEFISEQDHLADRAHREGRPFSEVIHRINMADAQSGIGFRWLQRSLNESYWQWFKFPWESYSLLHRMDLHPDTEEHVEASKLLEAQYRAAAAIALERSGAPDLAAVQWSRARKLEPSWSAKQFRALLANTPSSPFASDLDAAYLDTDTRAEFVAALEQIRRRIAAQEGAPAGELSNGHGQLTNPGK